MGETPLPAGPLTASHEHVVFAYRAVLNYLAGNDYSKDEALFENWKCPLFVTWKKKSGPGDPRLRGCIGILEPRPLHTALAEFAVSSAVRDRRFPPIQAHELPVLECTVSLLHSFEADRTWNEWQPSKHGIIISFHCPHTGHTRSATFLPEVAEHEGWSREETLEHLVQKAGSYLSPAELTALLPRIKLTRYQSTTATLTYQQCVALKDGICFDVDISASTAL